MDSLEDHQFCGATTTTQPLRLAQKAQIGGGGKYPSPPSRLRTCYVGLGLYFKMYNNVCVCNCALYAFSGRYWTTPVCRWARVFRASGLPRYSTTTWETAAVAAAVQPGRSRTAGTWQLTTAKRTPLSWFSADAFTTSYHEETTSSVVLPIRWTADVLFSSLLCTRARFKV